MNKSPAIGTGRMQLKGTLANDDDPRHGMNLVPPLVVGVLNESTSYSDVTTHRRNDRPVAKGAARRLCVRLRHGVVTHDLEHEVAVLGGRVPVVEQIGELRIWSEPSMRVAIGFVSHAVAVASVCRVYNGAADCDAFVHHE